MSHRQLPQLPPSRSAQQQRIPQHDQHHHHHQQQQRSIERQSSFNQLDNVQVHRVHQTSILYGDDPYSDNDGRYGGEGDVGRLQHVIHSDYDAVIGYRRHQ